MWESMSDSHAFARSDSYDFKVTNCDCDFARKKKMMSKPIVEVTTDL